MKLKSWARTAILVMLLVAVGSPASLSLARSEETEKAKPASKKDLKQRAKADRLSEQSESAHNTPSSAKAKKKPSKRLGLDRYKTSKRMGKAYLDMGLKARAFKQFAKYLAAYPDDTEIMLTAGIIGQELGLNKLARAYLENGLEKVPDHVEARLALACLNLDEGYEESALAQLEEVIQQDPARGEAHLILGKLYHKTGDLASAEASLKRASEILPQNLEANYLLAKMAYDRGDFASAIPPLERIAGKHEPRAEAHYLLAIAYLSQGRNESALEQFENAISADSQYEQAQYQAGLLWQEKGETEKAINRFSAYAEANADHFDSRWRLAQIYLEQGNIDRGIEWLEEAIKLEPNNPKALHQLGKIEYENGNYNKAYPTLRRALALDPKNTETRYLLGATYLHLPDFAAAERELQWILEREDKLEAREMLLEVGEQRAELAREPATGKEVSAVKTLAVVEFKDAGSDSGWRWLKTGLSEIMIQDMQMITSLEVIDPAAVDKFMRENSLPPGSTSPAFKRLGAKAILTGSYTVHRDQIKLSARLVETETTRLIASATRSGRVKDIFTVEREILAELIPQYVPLTQAERKSIITQPTLDLASLVNLSRGKKFYYLGKGEKAQEYLQKVVDQNPDYTPALADLREVQEAVSNAEVLAIMTFKNTTGNPDYNWMGMGIAESLTTDLKKITGIYLVERNEIDKALEELKLGMLGFLDESSAPQVGKIVGAGVILVGSYQISNKRLRIDARMVDVETGAILLTEKIQGLEDDIFKIEEQLALKISDALNVSLTAEEMARLKEKPNLENFKSYIISQASFRVGKEGEQAGEGEEIIRTVAVSKFKNYSGVARYDFLEEALAGSLVTELKRRAGMNMIERDQLDRAIQEMQLSKTTYVDEKTAPELGQIVGADAVLVGFYQISKKTIRVDTRVIKVDTAEVLQTVSVSGDVDDIFKVETELASEVMAALGVQGGPGAGEGIPLAELEQAGQARGGNMASVMAASYSFFLPGSSQYFLADKKKKGSVMFAADALLILAAAALSFTSDQAFNDYSSNMDPASYNEGVDQLVMRNTIIYSILALGAYSAVDGYLEARKGAREPPKEERVVAEAIGKP